MASTSIFHRAWRHLPFLKASCETEEGPEPTATDRMERAREMAMQTNPTIVSELEVQEYLQNETGRDRLEKMFFKSQHGQWSPDLRFITQVVTQTAGVTFMVMFIMSSRYAKQQFMDRNRATVFKTRFQAARRLQDQMFLFGMKEGFKWAVKVSVFTSSFLLIAQSIAVYRNKSSVMEYSLASALTVGAMKATLGLRGFLVGTGLGAVLGGIAGLIVVGGMKLSNETQEQRHYWQIQKELEADKIRSGKMPAELIAQIRMSQQQKVTQQQSMA